MQVHEKHEWVLSNANAIILAIVVALIIRHYCIEAFKIPSTSMEPVLIGDPRCGDRILVHKTAYLFTPPKRWDVVIFQYPNDHSRNFIKRLIALPNETVQIKNGNIYIDGQIAKKPPHIQQQLLYPVFDYRSQHSKESWGSYRDEAKWQWRNDTTVEAESEEVSWCNYLSQVTDKYVPQHDNLFFNRAHRTGMVGGRNDVGEVCLQFKFQIATEDTKVLVQFKDGYNTFRCHIKTDQTVLEWFRREEQTVHKQIIAENSIDLNNETLLEFSNLDDVVELSLDGVAIISFQLGLSLEEVPDSTYESIIQCGVENGSAIFSEFILSRDIYYVGEENLFAASKVWQVPKNHYFFLGDNPPNSRDSRDWERFSVFLLNGLALNGDQSFFPEGKKYEFTDLYGTPRSIPREQFRESYLSNISVPFVHQDLIQGQAFIVFWPPTRTKVIR